jgi:hypothetical protein
MAATIPAEPQYGGSVSLCDYVLKHQLESLRPRRIVDFGAGAGKNGKIARSVLREEATIIAVEGFEPTARMLAAEGPYDAVCHALIQDWVFADQESYDLAIFGDVLEHLRPGEIHGVLRQCLKKFSHIIVVCPLHDILQNEISGNALEAHQTYVTSRFFDRYNCAERHVVRGRHWTIMNLLITSSREPVRRRLAQRAFHAAMLALQPLGLARPFVSFLRRHFLRYKRLLRD